MPAAAPEFYHQIQNRPDREDWYEAMRTEDLALKNLQTYELVSIDEIPQSAELLPSRFVFNVKRNGLKKARLVAGGHKQSTFSFDDGSSSPAADTTSLKIFLDFAATHKGADLLTIDFKSAYLNSVLPENKYLKPPCWIFRNIGPRKYKFEQNSETFEISLRFKGIWPIVVPDHEGNFSRFRIRCR